jgi:hypothetical protein
MTTWLEKRAAVKNDRVPEIPTQEEAERMAAEED